MKEAAGEANMTVVTIILITAIVAVVTPIVMSTIANSGKRTCCTNGGAIWSGSSCYSITSTGARGNKIEESTYWNSTDKTCVEFDGVTD